MNIFYNSAKGKLLDGNIDLDSDTIKISLHTSAYTPDADNHDFFNDVSGELTVSGYTAGGLALAGKVVTVDNSNDLAYFDATDLTFTALAAGETIAGAVLYKSTGNSATSPLICYFDLSDTSTNNSDVVLTFSSNGLIRLS